ncbi:MAG TPA: hypothetical protein VJT32_10905 [bacterium]|nr:hypothetical protein [bacterium]
MRLIALALVLFEVLLGQVAPAGAASSSDPCVEVLNARQDTLTLQVDGYSGSWTFAPGEGPLYLAADNVPIHTNSATNMIWAHGGEGLIYWVRYTVTQKDFSIPGYCNSGTWLAVFRQ